MTLPDPPRRGFAETEFAARTARAQTLMAEQRIDVLLLTTEPELRYFSGFHSQFWESPTRPWFLILPQEGKPIAVIPEIGVAGMAATWVEEIHSWPAPQPEDEGISLLAKILPDHTRRFARLGILQGHESHLRMPLADWQRLQQFLPGVEIADASDLLRGLRNVKSPAEVAKIRYICQIASAGFEALPETAQLGESEREICRRLQLDLIGRGADWVRYMVAGSGPGGYDNIIMGPTDRVLGKGDVLIIDTGATYDGYFCDFDRNFAFGPPDDAAQRAHEVTYQATEAGLAAARPGITCGDLCAAMWSVLEAGGALGNDVGRLGHGLGMQLTEGPSHRFGDTTVLEPGMVLTLEPGMTFAPGKLMVHEENILITEDAPELLSRRAPPEMPVIG